MIKQLEWKLEEENWYAAKTPFGAYEYRTTALGEVRYRLPRESRFQTYYDIATRDVKSFLQLDFEERVKSMIDIPVDHGGTPFKLLPEDLHTHLHDFEKAVEIAVSVSNIDSNEESYWIKQRGTIARIKEQLK